MEFIGKIMNNQFLFYSILALISVGVIIVFTLLYMKRRNLKLFEQEERQLLESSRSKKELPEEPKEEVKITKINEESAPAKANLEEVLEKMQADLDKKEDVVALFEQEQEEKAIISYQELLNSKNKNTAGTNQDLLSVIEQIENGKQETGVLQTDYTLDTVEEPILEEKTNRKFKNTEFISPVYGKIENHTKYPTIPNFKKKSERSMRTGRNQVEVDKMEANDLEEEEIRNDAFLNALKKFRNNL